MTGTSQPSEYGHLQSISGKMGIIYGPTTSRRFGQALGINILPKDTKVCSFDCPYCDLEKTTIRMGDIKSTVTFPAQELIEESFREFFRAKSPDVTIDTIVISGNGDPLLHPDLIEIIDSLLAAKKDLCPDTPIALLTNGTSLDQKKIAAAVNLIDETIVKVDAGSDKALKQVNNPLVRMSVSKLINSLRPIKNVIVQSMFVQGTTDNTAQEAIEDWVESVALIKPSDVLISSLVRTPNESGLKVVSKDDLEVIAAKLERRTQIKAKVF